MKEDFEKVFSRAAKNFVVKQTKNLFFTLFTFLHGPR